MIYLDTHVVAWLYAGDIDRFPPGVRQLIENNELYISPAVILELQYLKEIKRLIVESIVIIETLSVSIGVKVCDQTFLDIIRASLSQSWTRDPFDRMIVGNAAINGTTLITKDSMIRDNYENAYWQQKEVDGHVRRSL